MTPRNSHLSCCVARDERRRRQRAYKKLDVCDQKIIAHEIQRLKITGLSDTGCFDLLCALGEFLARTEAG